MAGILTFDQLKKAVAAGEIDTVLACAVDMQGRLIGKRFLAKYFVESAYDETHGCNYLLANDIDMEPVPGYKAASWSKGYGDFVMKPDLSTIRHVPWLEKTALVLCDVLDHHTHDDLPHSPRAILRTPGEAAAGARLSRLFRLRARILPVRRNLRHRPAPSTGRTSTPPRPISRTTCIQLTTKEEGVMRAICATRWRRPASRSRTPRANGVRARKRSTSATPKRSRWPTATSS